MAKILVLANNDVGLYKFRKELLQELIRLKHIVFISLPNGEYIKPLVEIGCEFIETPIDRRGKNPIADFKLILSYLKIMKEVKPDVVLTYTIKPNIYGGIVCRIRKVPYLVNITGLGTAIENKGFLQKLALSLYKVALKKANCVFFQNESNQKLFVEKKLIEGNFKLIPGSGVNVNEYNYSDYPLDDKIIKFLFIGRIMKDKGMDELFSAADKIKRKYSNVQFNIVGDCEEDYFVEIVRCEKNGIIKYYGRQNDVRPFIKETHATILPSYHEGTANVLLESASMGRPVLASNIPGCRETFVEGVSGLGFNVKDVDSLVNVIIKFIELPYQNKIAMGISGRKKMEDEFNRELVIGTYVDEINECLNLDYKKAEGRKNVVISKDN